MTRLWRLLAVAGVVSLTAAVYVVPAVATSGPFYKDRFDNVAYDGNNGSASFDGPWVESGDLGVGPGGGALSVTGHPYCDGNCLTIGGLLISLDNVSITRGVDLQGVGSATLEWDWGREVLIGGLGGTVKAEVSADGDDWHELTRMRLDETDGDLCYHESHDITEYAGPDTLIRFRSSTGTQVAAYLLIDDVRITTTEQSTTTTTSPTTTTTTTVAPTTTTTTTTAPTTTTTAPTTSTTTSTVAPTTTTAPSSTVTTTTVPATTTTTTLPDDEDEAPIGLGAMPPPPADPTSAHRPADMVVSLSGSEQSVDMRSPVGSPGGTGIRLSPLENLRTMFTIAGGTVRSTGLAAIVLGLLLAALAVRGLGDRGRFRRPPPIAAD